MKQKPFTRCYSTILSIAIAAVTLPLAAQERPQPVSVPACTNYLHAVRTAQKALFDETFKCYHETRPKFGEGPECSYITDAVTYRLRAWPYCGDEHRQCELHRKMDDAFDCLRQAREQASAEEKAAMDASSLIAAEKTFDSVKADIDSLKQLINDPVEFYRKVMKKHLRKEILDQIGFDEGLGIFTGEGEAQMQETYDFLFEHTVGDEHARSRNPVIGALQGEIGGVLKRAQSYALNQMNLLSEMYSQVTLPSLPAAPSRTLRATPPPPAVSAPTQPSAQPAPPECAILATPHGAVMSMEQPDEYERLLRRCPAR